MSIEALSLVLKADIESSTDKFVLVALANHASGAGYCWPSLALIEQITSLNEKTVKAAIKRLLDAGYIFDTGERRGRTKQVKVYSINLPKLAPQADLFVEERKRADNGHLGDFEAVDGSGNGSTEPDETSPNPEGFQIGKGSDFGAKGGQKRPTEPSRTKIDISPGASAGEQPDGDAGAGDRPLAEHVSAAVALRRLGVAVNSMNPKLIAACDGGVTAEHLVDLAKAYPGKPVGYLIPIALQQVAERAAAAGAATTTTGKQQHAAGRESASARSERLAREADERERLRGDDDLEAAAA